MKNIALIGYSGHGYVVADTLLQMGENIIGYYEKKKIERNPYNLPYLGKEDESGSLQLLKKEKHFFFVAIGNNELRKKAINHLLSEDLATLIASHPSCIISNKAEIAVGTLTGPGAKINALAQIGIGVILNTGCIVEHECTIHNFAHIAPGAVLAGNVQVGEGSFVGAGAVIKQGVHIGKNSVIGAGAVVVKDVPDNQIWIGNPAKQFIQ